MSKFMRPPTWLSSPQHPGALTRVTAHLITAHMALRDSCHLEEVGATMALIFQWAPRSSTGQGDPRAKLCCHLTRNKIGGGGQLSCMVLRTQKAGQADCTS